MSDNQKFIKMYEQNIERDLATATALLKSKQYEELHECLSQAARSAHILMVLTDGGQITHTRNNNILHLTYN